MRILDRYLVRQLVPVWLWCLTIFILLSCLIDLFGHLDEILRHGVPLRTVLEYYLNFTPLVFVKASPLALLLSSAFVASRLTRHQEFLALNASGTSLLRASMPFLFVGWLASLLVFAVNDRVIPRTAAAYQELREEAFERATQKTKRLENVAVMDTFNRLYHARELNLNTQELTDLTILEHDWHNQPTKSTYASRAVWTPHGWLLLYGTIYRVGPKGALQGEPQSFVERLMTYPVSPDSFQQPEARPETMRFGQLRLLIERLKHMGMTNVRRYTVELVAKLSLPFMNVVACLIGFVGSTQPQLRGHLKGLGVSLLWGLGYYVAVAVGHGLGKERFLPVLVAVWLPHVLAVWWCLRRLRVAR